MSRTTLTVLALLLATVLTACGGQATTSPPAATGATAPPAATTAPPRTTTAVPTTPAAGAPQYGGTLKIILRQAPRNLYPPLLSAGSPEYARPAFEGLLRFNDKGEPIGVLATDWKFSPDFKTLTLNLRKGVKFHDGTEFNAAAAKFNLDARKASKLGDLDNVSSIDAVDDSTLRINLSAVDTTLILSLGLYNSWQSSPTAVQAMGKDKALFNPVGSGPFKFVSYEQGVRARYQRFDGYREPGRPYLDGVEYVIVADPTTAKLTFETGAAQAMGETDIKDTAELQQKGTANVFAPTDYMTVLCGDSLNADSPFAKQAVREAVDYAIDSAAIAKTVGFGLWEGTKQLASSKMVAYVEGMGRPYDPAKAKQLLAEAGYPNGFKTSIWARTVSPQASLQAVAGYLKEVGIDATLEPVDTGRYVQLSTGGWKSGLLSQAVVTSGRSAPDWLRNTNTILSAKSIEAKSLARSSNWQDTLVKALATTDAEAQKKLTQDLNRINNDEAMVIVPYVYARGYLTVKSVRNMDWFGTNYSKNYIADTWLSK